MGEDPQQDTSGHPSMHRVNVQEAARLLGITVDAVRKRVERGTITHEKGEKGRVWILLDPDMTRHDTDQDAAGQRPDPRDELLEEMRERIRYLERRLDEEREARTEERRRHDTLLAQLTSRIPQIEAPSEPRESPESPGPSETPAEERGGPQRAADRRWWEFWR